MLERPFQEQIAHLRRQLQQPLPGSQAHLTMAPGRHRTSDVLSVDNKPCRKAGVMAVLFPFEETAGIILTKRQETLNQHAGQISFPGGRNEPDESLLETALRETNEEVGLHPASIEVLGALSPLYISVSNFCVYPFVGAITPLPERLSPQAEEVQKILKLPLAGLNTPSTKRVERWSLRGEPVDIPLFDVEGETIWGATAMMLAELLQLYDV